MAFGLNFSVDTKPITDKFYQAVGLMDSPSEQRRQAVRLAARQEKASFLGRIEAARAAGIHPTAALGASIGNSPVVLSSSGDSSASVSVHPNPERDPAIERYNMARAKLAELDLQERQEQAAQRRLATQPGNSPAVSSWEVSPGVMTGNGQPAAAAAVQLEPVKLLPQVSPGVTPGVHPGSELWRDPVGGVYTRPAGAQAEQSELTNTVRDLSTHYGLSFGTALNLALAGLAAWPVGRAGLTAYRAFAARRAAALAARREATAAKKFVHPRDRR